ncbi:hypothetical protein ADUPG1_007248 [Aduncisulcus paluster]|uniref:Uncharacterized protein n=1 Tax=Aduncisulcus paluster TaxID=2918883 RepID=A0ABQ5KLA4_9EUKA|nr:hypothetical protein ADUPG1_007248 [Aduncisulcus paluster]
MIQTRSAQYATIGRLVSGRASPGYFRVVGKIVDLRMKEDKDYVVRINDDHNAVEIQSKHDNIKKIQDKLGPKSIEGSLHLIWIFIEKRSL